MTRKNARRQGLKYYFSSRPCIQGHFAYRQTSNGSCVECISERKSAYDKRYNEKHKDKISAIAKEYRARNKEKIAARHNQYRMSNAAEIKRKKIEYYQLHKVIIGEKSKAYREENRARVAEYHKIYKQKNKETISIKYRQYREENKAAITEYFRTYSMNNRDKCNARSKKRKCAKLKRTPPWLTATHLQEIQHMYALSAQLTKETGILHHVDHIVPLQGENVSGLHVPWNLRAIPFYENCIKSNKLIEI